MSGMYYLTEKVRISLAGLIREIVQHKPPLTHLDLYDFSKDNDSDQSAGEIILEALLNSSINTIQDLDLSNNYSWFSIGDTK